MLALFGSPDGLGIRATAAAFADSVVPPGRLGARFPASRGDWRPSQVVLPGIPPVTGGPAERNDPRLHRIVRLAGKDDAPAARLAYGEVLARVAAASGLKVVSDGYLAYQWHFVDARVFAEPAKLDQVLDRVSRAFQNRWRLEGDYLLFRHSRWYFEEQSEIPDTLAEQVALTVKQKGGLSLSDLSWLADHLNREQFRNLAVLYADFWPLKFRHHGLRLAGSLTAAQREAALSDGGLPFAALTTAQRELLLGVTRSERPQRLLMPLAARSQWRLMLRPTSPPAEDWVIGYQWGAGDVASVRLPAFAPIDATRRHDGHRSILPEWEATL